MKKNKVFVVLVLLSIALLAGIADRAGAEMPYTFSNGTVADADQVNSNFQQADPSRLWKTGQTTSYGTNDDGSLEKGATWPKARFTDNGNGTVTDNLTGLIWLKNANCFGTRSWTNALSDANSLASGSCGLSDGSAAGNWRLPNFVELYSLVNLALYGAVLVADNHPFTVLQTFYYWSSSTIATNTTAAINVNMGVGIVSGDDKANAHYVWPVRGGQ